MGQKEQQTSDYVLVAIDKYVKDNMLYPCLAEVDFDGECITFTGLGSALKEAG